MTPPTPDSVLEASCHCGALRLRVATLPASYTLCNCSICRRYAARWLYYRRDEVQIDGSTVLSRYTWGDRVIDFCFCGNCGCLTHYDDVEQTPAARVALNGNMLPPGTIEHLRVRHFDGAVSFKAIE